MIDWSHSLPLRRQAHLLDVSRSSLYYEPVATSNGDLTLMAAIDEIHLALPFYGIRRIRDELLARGFPVGRDHVATLMCRMGIVPLWETPCARRDRRHHHLRPGSKLHWQRRPA